MLLLNGYSTDLHRSGRKETYLGNAQRLEAADGLALRVGRQSDGQVPAADVLMALEKDEPDGLLRRPGGARGTGQ